MTKEEYWIQKQTKKDISEAWSTWRGRMAEEYGIGFVRDNPAMFTQHKFLLWYANMCQAVVDKNLIKREDLEKIKEAVNVPVPGLSSSSVH